MYNYISKILNARWFPDICKTPTDYKVLVKRLHPDVNNNKTATEAFIHLNRLKNEFENGYEFEDESGKYRSNYLVHRWGKSDLTELFKRNYDKLIQAATATFDPDSFQHFMNYLPSHLNWENDELVYRSSLKCIPLSRVIRLLPEDTKNKHVNRIYSRMIEFVTLLEALNITHAGLNPNSIFVIPETHGIKVTGFYHICTEKVKTINGKYKNYYPQQLFDTKKPGSYIDLSLIKKTALYGLGDPSGLGVKLRSDHRINQSVLEYLMKPESDALRSMKTWREIIKPIFYKRIYTF